MGENVVYIFIILECDVWHNDDGICKITSPKFYFLTSGK